MTEFFGYQTYADTSQPYYPFNTYAYYSTSWPFATYLEVQDLSTLGIINYYSNLLIMQYV